MNGRNTLGSCRRRGHGRRSRRNGAHSSFVAGTIASTPRTAAPSVLEGKRCGVGDEVVAVRIGLAGEFDQRRGDIDPRHVVAAALPFEDGTFELVVAFMSLQDMDDPEAAIREAVRMLASGGRLCLAILHPLRSAGTVDQEAGTFAITGSYFDTVHHIRPGIQVPSVHRPLETYLRALENAGLLVAALRELSSQYALLEGRIPAALHLCAVKP